MQHIEVTPALAELDLLRREARLARLAMRAAQTPAEQAEHAAELAELDARAEEVRSDPAVQAAAWAALDERAALLRLAVLLRREELAGRSRGTRASELRSRATRANRSLTTRERATVAALEAGDHDGIDRLLATGLIETPEQRDSVLAAVGAIRLREARSQLRGGLLKTSQMRRIIDEALPALVAGKPVLLLGETGGAKTALAEHLARLASGKPAELISGYGDITSAQLIGSHELRSSGQATVTEFVPGPLLRAMLEGRTVILDEVNAMPAEFLKRLNRILQLRPGDVLSVQENAGQQVEIAPGFAIIATANEQTPHRYRGLDRLSAELINRFGADSYRVHYPDSGVRYDEYPRENTLIAAAAVVDARGELPPWLTHDDIERAARVAFVSQQVFAGEHGEGFAEFVSTEQAIDDRPGLEENVLAPRTLVAILQKVALSGGTVTLGQALARFVEGVMHPEDRRVLALIVAGQGFRP